MTEEQIIEEARNLVAGEQQITTVLEACEALYMDGCADEFSGDMQSPIGYFYRVARWIVVTNSQGFHDLRSYESEEEAKEEFNKLDEVYAEWDDEEEV